MAKEAHLYLDRHNSVLSFLALPKLHWDMEFTMHPIYVSMEEQVANLSTLIEILGHKNQGPRGEAEFNGGYS